MPAAGLLSGLVPRHREVMNVFVFDIETIPDVAAGRRLFGLDGLADVEVAKVMLHRQRLASGSDFLRHPLHQIVAIAAVFRHSDKLQVWSLGDESAGEKELVERFFDGIERFSPTLVSWNGGGFDLPVLHYRALLHGVRAPRYWDNGSDDNNFRWNNYLNRFHERHTDLMDVLAGYQGRASASLQDIAILLGLPGKLGMDGSKVWDAFGAGELTTIRAYCETDVLNTYLIYLRFLLMRGWLDEVSYLRECQLVRDTLTGYGSPHLLGFLAAWNDNGD